MPIHRRDLVSAAASLAAMAALAPSKALSMTSRLIHGENDPLGVRPDFPILTNGRTYLDSAYITPCPRRVPAAGGAFLEAKSNRPITVGEMLSKAGEVRAQFARLVNATPDEIGFVFATTEGENNVANNIPLSPGDNVVVDNLHYDGALVVHRDGVVTPADIARRVDARTRLISVSCVSSVNGLRHDVRALADLAHAHGALLHVDAIQAIGMFPVDVRADDSAASASPPSISKKSLLERVPPDRFGIFQVEKQTPDYHFTLRNTGRRYDYATLPFAEVHERGAGLAYLEKVGVARIEQHTLGLTRRIEHGLLDQGHKLFTPAGNRSLFNNSDDVDRGLEITKRLV